MDEAASRRPHARANVTTYFAVADETGHWDMIGGEFGRTRRVGVAWVFGSADQWSRALQQSRDGQTNLKLFATSFAARVPSSVLPKSAKYHILDVLPRISAAFPLDERSEDPALEAMRSDIVWLLHDCELGVVAADDTPDCLVQSPLSASLDGMHVRARALAVLMGRALPFFLPGATLVMAAEGRTESPAADVFAGVGFPPGERLLEPFRDFAARLAEETKRISEQIRFRMLPPETISDFEVGGRSKLADALRKLDRREFGFLKTNAAQAAVAMLGIADLAASLLHHRPPGANKTAFPESLQPNLWLGSLTALGAPDA